MKGFNIKKYFLIIAVCAIIAIIVYSSGTNQSSTNAAYRTEVNGTDGARVAKWDINSLDKDGEEMSLSADVQNIETGSGNWFLEIENLSEVAAKLNSTSTIGIRLDSEIFGLKTYGNDNPWNFIQGETNPIKFVVYIYDCPLSSLLSYNMKQGGTTINISYAEYLALSEAERKACTEVVDESVDSVVVFDTSSTTKPMALDHVKEAYMDHVENYLYQEFVLSSVSLNFGINENTKKCVRIFWQIDDSIGSTTGTSDKFTIYDEETGAVVQENVDLFDYQKYISGLKGEPSYDLMVGDEMQTIRHERLSGDQETYLKSEYYEDDKTTPTDESQIKKTGKDLYQHLTYLMYENFKTKHNEYLQTLGYMECGLTCSIVFNFKIEQVD